MLDRIQNINQNKPYNRGGGARTSDFAKYFPKAITSDLFGKDSLNFSPAAIYLSRLKWHLHNIEYTGSEKVLLDIFIEDYEFVSEFDFSDYYSVPIQLFEISSMTSFGAKRTSNIAKVNYVKNELNVHQGLGKNSIEDIGELFFRIEKVKLSEEKKDMDTFFLRELIRDIEGKLELEFEHILNQMYTFIYKLNKFNLKEEYLFENPSAGLITLKEISTIYG